MYKSSKVQQISLTDFNQALGFKIDPENRWVKRAALIPWLKLEEEYAQLFPSRTGTVAKPLRMALGALLIQKHYKCSDQELVETIRENAYLQYFIGLSGYQYKKPFVPSLMVEFRKRIPESLVLKTCKIMTRIRTKIPKISKN